MPGNMERETKRMGHDLTSPFNALTASLCSHSFAVAVKRTHRIGTSCFSASSTQWARVSGSAFVLSDRRSAIG